MAMLRQAAAPDAEAKTGAAGGSRPPAPRPARRRRARPRAWRDWSVSWRLMAVAIIAILVDLTLGGLRVAATTDSTASFSQVTQLAVLGQRVTGLAQALEDERDQVAGFIAAGRPAAGEAAVGSAEARTNAAAGQVTSAATGIGPSFPGATQAKVTAVLDRIADLPGLRQAAVGTQLPSLPVTMDYTAALNDLFSLNDEIAQGSADPAVADSVRALGDLSRLEEAASRQRGLLFAALTEGYFEPGALADLINAQSAEAGYLQAFQNTATPALRQAYNDTVTGTEVDAAQLIEQRVIATGSPRTGGLGLPAGSPARQWYTAMAGTLTPIRAVEAQLTGSIMTQSQALDAGPRRSALITVAFTVAVLIFVLAVTAVVARSLVLPLRRLKSGALEIANASLPARVRELADRPDVDPNLEVQPISVQSADEIGQVARAFDQVHAEALRLAGNEAILRRNVSAMFVSLSHRSQVAIDRLSRMITATTATTASGRHLDEELRSDLAAMDRLLAQMRRNCENLLVLAGYETVRKWTAPVPLTDVVRAATSGIDPSRRLSVSVPPELVVVGYAVTDVTHLLAELLENAANFSPREAPITVAAARAPSGGVQVDVTDAGLGMTADRMGEMNDRLADPPVADALVSRHMGLFAVAHLAARHGAVVRLQAAGKGLVVQVWLPDVITEGGVTAQAPAGGGAIGRRGDPPAGCPPGPAVTCRPRSAGPAASMPLPRPTPTAPAGGQAPARKPPLPRKGRPPSPPPTPAPPAPTRPAWCPPAPPSRACPCAPPAPVAAAAATPRRRRPPRTRCRAARPSDARVTG
jgi:signal transduction histidine kinase